MCPPLLTAVDCQGGGDQPKVRSMGENRFCDKTDVGNLERIASAMPVASDFSDNSDWIRLIKRLDARKQLRGGLIRDPTPLHNIGTIRQRAESTPNIVHVVAQSRSPIQHAPSPCHIFFDCTLQRVFSLAGAG